MLRLGVAALVATGACVTSNVVVCGDGRVCPEGHICDNVNKLCVTQQQVDLCTGMADGTPCMFGDRDAVCLAGACVQAFCGDGAVSGAEQCDGANLGAHSSCNADTPGLDFYYDSPLACAADCTYDTATCRGRCGDAIRDFTEGEYCDTELHPGNADACTTFGYDAGTLTCSSSCSPGLRECVFLRAVHESSLADPHAMWGSSATDVFAVGERNGSGGGILLHFDGTGWREMAPPATLDSDVNLYAVFGTSPSDVYAVGHTIDTANFNLPASPGTVLHYDGSAWSVQSSPASIALHDVWVGDGTGFAVGELYNGVGLGDGKVLQRNGTTWSEIAPPAVTSPLRAVWAFSATDVFVAGDAGIWRFNGQLWTPQSVSGFVPIYKLWALSATELYAVGGSTDPSIGGAVFRFDGATWSELATPTCIGLLTDVWGTSATSLYFGANVTGGKSRPLYHYDGSSFTPLAAPIEARARAIWGSSPTDIWMSTFSIHHATGSFFTTTNPYPEAGACSMAPPTTTCDAQRMRAIAGRSTTDVYAFGDNAAATAGYACHYDGVHWSPVDTGSALPRRVTAASVAPSGAVFAAGANIGSIANCGGGVLVTELDPILLWAASASGPWNEVVDTSTGHQQYNDVWAASATDVFVVGLQTTDPSQPCTNPPTAGFIRRWTGGSTLSDMTIPATAAVRRVWGTSANDVFALAAEGHVYHYDGNVSETWVEIPAPTSFCPAVADLVGVGSHVFVACKGELYRYDAGTWTTLDPHGVGFGVKVSVVPLSDTDVFVFGGNASSTSVIAHYDIGDDQILRANPVAYDGKYIFDAWGTATRIFWVDDDGVHSLVRPQPW